MGYPQHVPPKQRELIGAILAGLQVPVSIGVTIGEALEPYEELRKELKVSGWLSAEEFTEVLRKEWS